MFAEVLNRVLRPYFHGKLCICGIGNKSVPADALGPEVTNNLPLKVFSEVGTEGNFCEVCSIVPGTLLTNNIDTEVIVKGVVREIGADCVLLVDSLMASDPERLFQTIQISTTGGLNTYLSGRNADWSILGIPVISLGIPMAIPSSVLFTNRGLDGTVFTATNIQELVAGAGRIIAYAILRACWPLCPKAECFVMSGVNSNPIPESFLLGEEHGKD